MTASPSRASSRETVLAAIRQVGLVPTEAPRPWPSPPIAETALAERFAAALEAAGGTSRVLAARDLADALAAHADRVGATTVHSSHPDLASRHPGPLPQSPHDLAQLELTVIPGGPSVAESGAVWVAPADRLTRAACFLTEHLALVVEASEIVADLHHAYARIAPAASPFGCWIAGPSKTADIEQVLVVGAHGPRTLSVFITE